MRIYTEIYGGIESELVHYIMFHDSAEVITGDLPYTAKRLNPGLKSEMSLAEERAHTMLKIVVARPPLSLYTRFKRVEYIEMLETAVDELRMGNKFMQDVYDNMRDVLMIDMDDATQCYLEKKGLHKDGFFTKI